MLGVARPQATELRKLSMDCLGARTNYSNNRYTIGRRVNRNLHASSWNRSVFSLMMNIVLTSLGRSANRQAEHAAYAPARNPSQNREFLMARAA